MNTIITNEERETLVKEIANLLTEYDYEWSYCGIDNIIDTWAKNKASLIEAFKRHPNYIEGKFMIAFDKDFVREKDKDASRTFAHYITGMVAGDMRDFVPDEIKKQRDDDGCLYLPTYLYRFLSRLGDLNQFLTETEANDINNLLPNIHAHNGQKTSRVINKICGYLGYDKHPLYNREFAKYADSLNPLKIKRHTVLSINPLDYYTMSFGNSWASCHTIDKTNKRGMPNNYQGCYSSGTESYMLDGSTMVFYTIDAAYDGNKYYTQPKINRQMFHFGEDKLIQGRLYPQDNDYNAEGYAPYRNIVQEIIAMIFNFPNLWVNKKGTHAASEYIISEGTHYRDYEHFDNCNISYIKGSENSCEIIVGHNPICPSCGDEHNNEENICCQSCIDEECYCHSCGCCVSEEDGRWIDGEFYCDDCCFYCNECMEYHVGDSRYVRSEGITICEDCYDRYFFTCDECHDIERNDEMTYVDDDSVVCSYCRDRYYEKCIKCGEYYRREEMTEIRACEYICEYCCEENEETE